MIANGMNVAVMEHHVSSSATGFPNVYGQSRISYLNISGIPDSYFDATIHEVGGYTGTYNAFVNLYNQRIVIPSNFTIALNGFNAGDDYTVVATVTNVEPYSGPNLKLYFVVTESGVMYGSTPFHHVTRYMDPDQNATTLDFSSGTTQSVMLDFTMDPAWNIDECEFIAFVEDMDTKEILQGTKVTPADLMPMYYDNAGCLAVNMVPVTNCTGEIAPEVTITNEGATNLSTVEINYQVNEENLNTFNWTGSLAYGETELVTLPSVALNVLDENDVTIYTTNPNGNPDEDPINDTTYTSFASAVEVIPNIYLFLKLDDNPEETSWELKNSTGDVLYSGGNYTQALEFVKDTFALTLDDCYTFFIYDDAGDGLSNGGYFALRESNFNLIYQDNEFANSDESVQFSVNLVGVAGQNEETSFNVFPNPFTENTNVSFSLKQAASIGIKVYNMLGEVVYMMPEQMMIPGQHVTTIDANGFNPGIYFISLKKDGESMTRKVTLR